MWGAGMKNKKKVYEDQKDALEKFRRFIVPKLKGIPEVREAVLWGSLARGNFGFYDSERVSDVDLIILLEPGAEVPKDWKDIGIHKSWFDGYRPRGFTRFDYRGNEHKVDLLVIKRDALEMAKRELRGEVKLVYQKGNGKGKLR